MRKLKKIGIIFKVDSGIVVTYCFRDKYRNVYRLNEMMSGIYFKSSRDCGGKGLWINMSVY